MKTKLNIKYLPYMLLSLVGVVLMLTYDLGFYAGTKSMHEHSIITPFYFTFISNALGLVLMTLKTFNIFKDNSKHHQRFEIMATVNLAVTMLVFWAVLAPFNKTWNNAFATIQTLFVHLFTPSAIIAAFLIKVLKEKQRTELPALKTSLINISMPLIWIVVATIIYFSLGANENAAVYDFIDFNNHKIMAAIAIPGIAIVYFGFTFGATYLSSRKIK